MAKITLHFDNHEQPYPVSEMRKVLGQLLANLNGNQGVTFSFMATLEDYHTARETGNSITKIPDAPDTRHAKSARQDPDGAFYE